MTTSKKSAYDDALQNIYSDVLREQISRQDDYQQEQIGSFHKLSVKIVEYLIDFTRIPIDAG
ncbi:hypothetical protein KML24002_09310 [Alistipes putredinis]